jgi:hypothetical protein
MSFIPLGISVATALLEGLLSPVFVRPRSIGGFIADVTVEERADDEVEMTQIPIETGAAITDHAFKRPSRLLIRAGWSNSSARAFGNPAYDILIYNAFLFLQQSLIPFQVITGKRVYNDMLVRRISQTTNEMTENALMLTIECQQVLFVTTQTVNLAPASQLKNQAANAPTNPVGQQGLQTGNNYNQTATPT